MSSRIGVVPTRLIAASIALAFALCLLGVLATAQTDIQPKDEIFGGYSWLHPNAHVDNGFQVQDISKGFDFSNVYYLPSAHNLGVLGDVSGHWGNHVNAGYLLGGLQYKFHTDTFSPFVRVFVGASRISPSQSSSEQSNSEWNVAVGGGGGFDLNVTHNFAIRLAQVDYIYSNYHGKFLGESAQLNSIRLAAGIVVNLGDYYAPALAATCTAQPIEVTEGEPVTVTATGANFNSKHTITYAWTTDGGKIDTANAQSAHIDTTGASAGPHTANATLTDAKMRKMNSAKCSAPFTVKAKPMNPPVVTCSANPTTVPIGSPDPTSKITANATSPDTGVTISSYAYTASAGTINGTGTTATLDTTGAPAGPITVGVTATDSRGLTNVQPCLATVTVEGKPVKPDMTSRTLQFIERPKQKYIPWRVDNEAKAILDQDALALKNDPNSKLFIVGYADGEPQPKIGMGKKKHAMDLAAQRAVNAKAYLVQQQGIDPSRIEVRKGTGKAHEADTFFWVPQDVDPATASALQGTTPVDESVVTPSENAYPKPKTAAPMHHHKKAAAAAAAETTGNAMVEGTETAGKDVGKAAKKTGHVVKKGAKATEDTVTPH
jgi:opacity protein-like surface antigen